MPKIPTSVTLDESIIDLAEKMAARENRNFSNLCEVALKEYCGARGIASETDELIAAATEVGIQKALKLLRDAKRKKAA